MNESCVDCDVDGDDDDDQHISVDCRDVDLIDAEDLLLGRVMRLQVAVVDFVACIASPYLMEVVSFNSTLELK